MNYKVLIVLAMGLTAMLILLFVPPMKAVHATCAGHCDNFREVSMEFDTTRFYIEEGAIALMMGLLVIKTKN